VDAHTQGRGPYTMANELNLPEHYREMTKLDDPFGGECMNMYKAGEFPDWR
jgi:hypothetical protein